MTSIGFNKNFDIGRVVKRLVGTILALYVGGVIMTTFGSVMNCTTSPFYKGLALIGWTVTDVTIDHTNGICTNFVNESVQSNVITATSGSGVLAVIGVIGIGSVVMEFISWN